MTPGIHHRYKLDNSASDFCIISLWGKMLFLVFRTKAFYLYHISYKMKIANHCKITLISQYSLLNSQVLRKALRGSESKFICYNKTSCTLHLCTHAEECHAILQNPRSSLGFRYFQYSGLGGGVPCTTSVPVLTVTLSTRGLAIER